MFISVGIEKMFPTLLCQNDYEIIDVQLFLALHSVYSATYFSLNCIFFLKYNLFAIKI